MNNTLLFIYLLIAFYAFIIAEVAAYLWHRYLAHGSFISNNLPMEAVRESHRFHHSSNLRHDASEDFVWIVYGLSGMILILGIVYRTGYMDWMNKDILSVLLIVTSIAFILNWYIHLAVHTPNHWLQSLGYVQDVKTVHFVHHKNPYINYSIMNFTDTTFGTFGTGFEYTMSEVRDILDGKV